MEAAVHFLTIKINYALKQNILKYQYIIQAEYFLYINLSVLCTIEKCNVNLHLQPTGGRYLKYMK